MEGKKKRSQCEAMLKKCDEIIPHPCNANYEGSSGGMERRLAVDLVTQTWRRSNLKVRIGTIIADDDSTLKSNTANKKDGWLVDDEIQRPTFLVDPSHRIKYTVRLVFNLVQKNKKMNQ